MRDRRRSRSWDEPQISHQSFQRGNQRERKKRITVESIKKKIKIKIKKMRQSIRCSIKLSQDGVVPKGVRVASPIV